MEGKVAFYQRGPRLGNAWLEDDALRRLTGAALRGASAAERARVERDLERFAGKCCGEYLRMAANAERFKPELEQFDQWGRRVDRIHVSEGWRFFKRESAIEGLVALAYEGRGSGPGAPLSSQTRSAFARVHQAVKLVMFAPSSGMYSCPLAMTDGAAFALDAILRERSKELPRGTVAALAEAYEHLTTRDPDAFWTSGQWFTERKAGSDLSRGTETVAVPLAAASATSATSATTHSLHGLKFFTSAIDAEMTLTLASVAPSRDASLSPERKSLSMFFLRVRRDSATRSAEERAELEDALNGIQVHRLKDKMATRQLPTAELVLDGALAHLVSAPGQGVRAVAPMLTITRFHNSVAAAAYMLRMRSLAVDFAHSRAAFGGLIVDKALHLQSLFEYDMDARGSLLLVLEFARLLGRDEAACATPAEALQLRVITSLAKLFTAREAVRLMSDGVELFGAVGVMEGHMSTLLRDAQVLPIWEGTTNTLALDLVRVAAKEPHSLDAVHRQLLDDLLHKDAEAASTAGTVGNSSNNNNNDKEVQQVVALADQTFARIRAFASDQEALEANSRRLSMQLARLWITALAARAARDEDHVDELMLFRHWAARCVREHEAYLHPSVLQAYRATLPRKMNGAQRDASGNLRSYV